MDYRYLGRSGLQVSSIGLGCNNFGGRCDREQTEAVVHRALTLGVNFFDLADIYPPGGPKGLAEEYFGAVIKGHRREVVLATKFGGPMGEGPGWRGGSRRYIRAAVEASLRRLGTDYIDLYQLHFPDPATPIAETLSALDDLVHAGLVRYVGCSNFSAWQVAEAAWTARTEHLTPFISAQNPYNLLDRAVERELIPACLRYGLGLLPYYPLASGVLTGKYRAGEAAPPGTRLAAGGFFTGVIQRAMTEGNLAAVQRLENFATEREHSVADLAIAWLSAQSAVSSVIAGATKPEQVEANVEAGSWTLTAEEVAEVSEITKPA